MGKGCYSSLLSSLDNPGSHVGTLSPCLWDRRANTGRIFLCPVNFPVSGVQMQIPRTLDCEGSPFLSELSLWNSEIDDSLPLLSLWPFESTGVITKYLKRALTLRKCVSHVPSIKLTLSPWSAFRSLTPFPGQVVLSSVILSVSRWLTLVVTQKSWTALSSLKDLMVRLSQWLLGVFLSFRCHSVQPWGFSLFKHSGYEWLSWERVTHHYLIYQGVGEVLWHQLLACPWNQTCPPTPTLFCSCHLELEVLNRAGAQHCNTTV